MPNNAKISIVGNLTRDPQTRQAGSSSVASFSVAVNTMNKKADGAYDSNFYDVSAFGKLGEYLMQHLQKGSQVWVNGDFAAAEYTNKDGAVRHALRISATDVRVLSRGKNEGSSGKISVENENDEANKMPF